MGQRAPAFSIGQVDQYGIDLKLKLFFQSEKDLSQSSPTLDSPSVINTMSRP
ncbi:MAG: hypothetical protein O6849_08625 [Candidatus Dadabacteria bacterium]|nr:hypothetical protein [Candidatus Dadabacteria bacterium]MCZ6686029.1 hypothetical protein [Candidatus Dadabacteria bacterium]